MDTTVIHVEDGVNGYVDLVNWVLKYGKEVAPRGQQTKEIEDATVFIDNVYNTLPVGVSRGAVPGNIGNIQQGTADGTITVPTTRHLHFGIRMPIVSPSTGNLENVPLPPYVSLVEAYQRLQAGTP